MKMYILVRESVPLGFAMVGVAHASMAAYIKFADDAAVKQWISGPFYKAVCRVSDVQFDEAKACPDHVIITESALGGQETVLAFKPREVWPKSFKFFSLYR
ncbi:MAG TPA: hypothetical protein VFE47_05300 [Tepidisphaeraceae bacterium]|jgi:peptidyl-tRNA hydrolase|nr:hypothetical protein [Tepidisphaeraceae bacterium]